MEQQVLNQKKWKKDQSYAIKKKKKKKTIWHFPGGPAAKSLHFQYRGPGFNPLSGN